MELQVGQAERLSKKIISEDLFLFAKLSLDENPIHLDETYAEGTIFKKRIAHGMYVASLLSAVIANKLPGRGTIYLGQNLKFLKPVFLGDEITATVEVIEIPKPGQVRLKTQCINQNGEVVIDGDALVKPPRAI